MATKKAKRRVLRPFARHPWREWFARGHFTLRRGVDYANPTTSFAQQVGTRARRDGLSVSVFTIRKPDGVEIVVHGQRE